MIPLSIRRVGVVLALAGVGVLGAVSAANADATTNANTNASAVAGSADTPSAAMARGLPISEPAPTRQAAALAWSATFDRVLTAGLWNAAQGGAAAVVVFCGAQLTGFLRNLCMTVATTNLFGMFISLGPPDGRCLNMSPRLGIPPYRLKYITCP